MQDQYTLPLIKKVSVRLLTILLFATATGRSQQTMPPNAGPAAVVPVTQWPQHLDSPDGLITVYEPQPTVFEGNTLTARAAVALSMPGQTEPEFGAMWFTARVYTDRDARTVAIENITIKQVKLPHSNPDQEKQFAQVVEQRTPSMNLMLSLDQLEATLGVVQKEKEETQQFENTPPKIIFTATPTTLVLLDGPPKLQDAQVPGVMTVINTPFIMLLDISSKRYFLKAGDMWMVATDVQGPWTPAVGGIPPGIADSASKLTAQNAQPTVAPQPTGPTQILVAEEPTELISSQGQPTYSPIVGNDLLYMTNTQSDVFLEIASQQFYVLLSGRWFTGKSMQGPWAFVPSDKLPASFPQIPPDSPKANVLVSVAGTAQAHDAKLDAFIPQTTAIRRDAGVSVQVDYDGSPQFAAIQNTPITYASNCTTPVLCVSNLYYCCQQAVWYRSGSAIGPWAVCDSVPAVIYTLPPSCPVYNCRYVYVYDSTPDVVYCGYLAGYTGSYVYGPTIVYGTGYQYPSWYRTRFIPYPSTWGFAPRYDSYAGSWGFGSSFAYGPAWFTASPERRNWFGPQGYVDYHDAHRQYENARVVNNVRERVNVTDVRNLTVNRVNIYNRQENSARNVAVKNQSRATPANQTGQHQPAREDNNVFAGADGQVYRRTEQGWQTRGAKGWSTYQPAPGNTPAVKPGEHAEQSAPDLTRQAAQPHKVGESNTPPGTPQDQQPQQTEPRRVEAQHIESQKQAPEQANRPSPAARPPGLEDEFNARQRSTPPANRGGDEHQAAPAEQRPAAPAAAAAPHGGGAAAPAGGNNGQGRK